MLIRRLVRCEIGVLFDEGIVLDGMLVEGILLDGMLEDGVQLLGDMLRVVGEV